MKLTDNSRWLIGLIVVVFVAITIALITNLNTFYNFGRTNTMIEMSSKENIEASEKTIAAIDASSEKTIAAIESSSKETKEAIESSSKETKEAIESSSKETKEAIEETNEIIRASSKETIEAINNSSTVIVEAILSTSGSSSEKSDSTSESSDFLVENTSNNNIFAVIESDNKEVYLNLAGAIQESGLVPNSEVLSPLVLISLYDRFSQEDLARLLSLSEVPIVKESFVTYNENSAEYALFWNILAPSIVPSHLEGAPLTISYATTN